MCIFFPERSDNQFTYDAWGDYVAQFNPSTSYIDHNLAKFKLGFFGGTNLLIGLLRIIGVCEFQPKPILL